MTRSACDGRRTRWLRARARWPLTRLISRLSPKTPAPPAFIESKAENQMISPSFSPPSPPRGDSTTLLRRHLPEMRRNPRVSRRVLANRNVDKEGRSPGHGGALPISKSKRNHTASSRGERIKQDPVPLHYSCLLRYFDEELGVDRVRVGRDGR